MARARAWRTCKTSFSMRAWSTLATPKPALGPMDVSWKGVALPPSCSMARVVACSVLAVLPSAPASGNSGRAPLRDGLRMSSWEHDTVPPHHEHVISFHRKLAGDRAAEARASADAHHHRHLAGVATVRPLRRNHREALAHRDRRHCVERALATATRSAAVPGSCKISYNMYAWIPNSISPNPSSAAGEYLPLRLRLRRHRPQQGSKSELSAGFPLDKLSPPTGSLS